MSANLSGGKDTEIWTVSQLNPKKQKVWDRPRSDLKKLICNPRWTNKEQKISEPSYLPPLSVNQDQDVIQIDNNTKALVMAKEQDRFSEGCENPRGCGQPKQS